MADFRDTPPEKIVLNGFKDFKVFKVLKVLKAPLSKKVPPPARKQAGEQNRTKPLKFRYGTNITPFILKFI